MDIFDLMKLYFPNKKSTISRIKNIDSQNRIKAKQIATEYETNGYHTKLADDEFLSCMNVVIPISWLGNDVDKILNEIEKLRNKVDKIGEVSLENTNNGEPALNFRWFPYTTVMSQITLCVDFIQLLLNKIRLGEDVLPNSARS